MPPVDGAAAALSMLREVFELVIVTSRQHVIEEETRAWVDRHYKVRRSHAWHIVTALLKTLLNSTLIPRSLLCDTMPM